MSYNKATVTLPLFLKGYCFLRVSYLYEQMRGKTELIFAVADKRNDTAVGYLCKGKPGGFVSFIQFFVFLTFSRTLLFYCAVCRNKNQL